MDRGQFVDWLYESPTPPRDSVVVARAIFFEHIPRLRSRIVLSLFVDVFPSLLALTSQAFGKAIAIQEKAVERTTGPVPPPSLMWVATLSVLGNIPKDDMEKVFKDWATVRNAEHADTFCAKLEAWGRAENLNVDWAYDLVIKVLTGWMADRHVMWLGQLDNISLEGELTASWNRTIRLEQLGWDWKRVVLGAAAYEVIPFRFEAKKKPKGERVVFRAPAWRFLVEQKAEWVAITSRRFQRFAAKRELADDPLPVGTRGRFRKALAAYLKAAEARKRKAISEHGLVRPAQFYEGQDIHINMERLIRFQIPPCETYEVISSGLNVDAIRKQTQRTAHLIGLPLRSRKRKRQLKGPGSTKQRSSSSPAVSKPFLPPKLPHLYNQSLSGHFNVKFSSTD